MKTNQIINVCQAMSFLVVVLAMSSVDNHPECKWAVLYFLVLMFILECIKERKPKIVTNPVIENDQYERQDDDCPVQVKRFGNYLYADYVPVEVDMKNSYSMLFSAKHTVRERINVAKILDTVECHNAQAN